MGRNRYRILIAEPDTAEKNALSTLLEQNGYHTLSAETHTLTRTLFLSHNPDLILLEPAFPDGSGRELILQIREASGVPILVLSSQNSEGDKVAALDAGANDYIVKPYGNAELLARIRAALRNRYRDTDTGGLQEGKFTIRDLTVDYDRRKAYLQGRDLELTQTEYNILALLCAHPGKFLTYTAIIRAVWGYPDTGSIKKLQVNIANLRKKLGVLPNDDPYLRNEAGIGYQLIDREK